MKTLGEFVIERARKLFHATGELTALGCRHKTEAKIIHRDINKAGLVDRFRASGAGERKEKRFSRNSTCSLMKN